MIEELMALQIEADDLRKSGNDVAAEKIETIIHNIKNGIPAGNGHGGD